jgi:SLAP domain-containing protein
VFTTSGQPYTPVGDEMASKGTGAKTPIPTTSEITVDGREVSATAYNIGGYNYFKLRDIGLVVDFGVDWDGASNAIAINTDRKYIPEPDPNDTNIFNFSSPPLPTPGNVTFGVKRAYYSRNMLVAEMYVVNGLNVTVSNLRDIKITLSNAAGVFAHGEFGEMVGAAIPANGNIVWKFAFTSEAIIVWDAVLTGNVTSNCYVTYNH